MLSERIQRMTNLAVSTLEARASVHAALADVHRLAIVDELWCSDRSPSELGAALGLRSNLVAHHLQALRAAGVIEIVRSSGDGRRRYVRLRSETLSGLAPVPAAVRGQVLFVCSANSARSPLAAAIWGELSGVPAESAGTHPASEVHPLAVAAATRAGLDLRGVRPRAVAAVEREPSLSVTVCDEAHEELPAGLFGGCTGRYRTRCATGGARPSRR
jgi:DNA-binding transcriptional ArsR family regulator